MYDDKESLKLTKRVYITKEVHELLREEKKRLRRKGIKRSIAKIVCNLILKEYYNKYN